MTAVAAVDPFTFEVVTRAMVAIVEEAGITLMKASYTPLIKEGFDFSCVLLDAGGELIAVASHTPIQMCGVSFATRAAIDEFRAEGFEEGDVVIVNDPYRGGNHLPDVSLITPFFHDGKLLFFVADRAHWEDIGGASAGSVSANTRELYGEGLRIPPVKLVRRGEVQGDVLKLIMSNLRVPEEREGDMRAQIAANDLARRRLSALIEKFGVDTVNACAAQFKLYSERRVRAEIERIPDGVYEFLDFMDNDGITGEFVRFACTLTVNGSEMTVDLSGSAGQRPGPINSPLANTIASVMVAVQHFLEDPSIPLNEGTYRPIRVIAPEGSIVNPRFPAACGSVTGSARRIIWTVLGALGQAVPARMTGSNFGSLCDIGISGIDPRTNSAFVIYVIVEGGWGARHDRDGMSAMRNLMGQIMNTPSELFEVQEPLAVERLSLRADSGGPGKFRGGLGVIREYRALTDCTVTIALDRTRIGPWGFAGGRSAARMEVEIHRADGERISIARLGGKVTGLRLANGDSMVILSPGGGGWGPPFERAIDAVEGDVRSGYVSAERALSDYGVKIEATTMAADRSATERARAGMRSAHRNEELYCFDVEFPEFAELNRAAYPRALANGLGDLLHPTRAGEKRSGNKRER